MYTELTVSGTDLTALDKIKKELDARRVPYQEDGGRMVVEPSDDDGFTVWLDQDGESWVVGFDGWHEHFNTDEEAFALFGLGLTDECRLRVRLRGGREHRWTVEALDRETGDWEAGSTTGRIFFPFWRRRTEVIRQNRWNAKQ